MIYWLWMGNWNQIYQIWDYIFELAIEIWPSLRDKKKSAAAGDSRSGDADLNIEHQSKMVIQRQWATNHQVWGYNLVGGLEHFLFFHILGMSSSQLTN